MKKIRYNIGDDINSICEIKHECDPKNTAFFVYKTSNNSPVWGVNFDIFPNKIILYFGFPIINDEYYILILQDEENVNLNNFINEKNKTPEEAIEALKWMWN